MAQQSFVTVLDIINFGTGLISLALGLLAFFLSFYFYNKTRDSEVEIARMLGEIRTQTEVLQKVTSRQLDRFIKTATDQKPFDELFLTIFSAVRSVPDNNLQLHLKDQEIKTLSTETLRGYIAAYYYSAVANVVLQLELPNSENYDPSNQGHSLVKNMIDESHKDYLWLKGVLQNVDQPVIRNHPVCNYYDATIQYWDQYVKDSATSFAEKANPS